MRLLNKQRGLMTTLIVALAATVGVVCKTRNGETASLDSVDSPRSIGSDVDETSNNNDVVQLPDEHAIDVSNETVRSDQHHSDDYSRTVPDVPPLGDDVPLCNTTGLDLHPCEKCLLEHVYNYHFWVDDERLVATRWLRLADLSDELSFVYLFDGHGNLVRVLTLPPYTPEGDRRYYHAFSYHDGAVTYAVNPPGEGQNSYPEGGSEPWLEVYDLGTDLVVKLLIPSAPGVLQTASAQDQVLYVTSGSTSYLYLHEINAGNTRLVAGPGPFAILDSDGVDRALISMQFNVGFLDAVLYAFGQGTLQPITDDPWKQLEGGLSGDLVAMVDGRHDREDECAGAGYSPCNMEIYTKSLSTGQETRLTNTPDVEANASIRGDLVAYTRLYGPVVVHNLARGQAWEIVDTQGQITLQHNTHKLRIGGTALYYLLRWAPHDDTPSVADHTLLLMRYDLDCHCELYPDNCPL